MKAINSAILGHSIYVGGQLEIRVEERDDYDTFVVAVIMTGSTVGHTSKAVTSHQLLLPI